MGPSAPTVRAAAIRSPSDVSSRSRPASRRAPCVRRPTPRPAAMGRRFSSVRDRPRLSLQGPQSPQPPDCRPRRPTPSRTAPRRRRQPLRPSRRGPVADVGEGDQAAQGMIALRVHRPDMEEQIDLGRGQGRQGRHVASAAGAASGARARSPRWPPSMDGSRVPPAAGLGQLLLHPGLAFRVRVQRRDAIPLEPGFAPTSDPPVCVAEMVVDLGVGRLLGRLPSRVVTASSNHRP